VTLRASKLMRGIQEKEPHGESSMVRTPYWRTTVSMAALACADASAVLPGPLLVGGLRVRSHQSHTITQRRS
jgi:hypothetical protein